MPGSSSFRVQIRKMKIPIGETLQIGMRETKKFALGIGLTPKGDIEKTTTSHYGKMKKLRLQLAWHDSKACHKRDKIRIYSLFFDLSLIPFHDHARFECVGFTGGRNTCTIRHRHIPGHGTGDFHFNHRHIA